jgi:hypothetical protein
VVRRCVHSRRHGGLHTGVSPVRHRHPCFICPPRRFHLHHDGQGVHIRLYLFHLLTPWQITVNLLAQIVPGTLAPGNPMANTVSGAFCARRVLTAHTSSRPTRCRPSWRQHPSCRTSSSGSMSRCRHARHSWVRAPPAAGGAHADAPQSKPPW